jgi:plastocyanin
MLRSAAVRLAGAGPARNLLVLLLGVFLAGCGAAPSAPSIPPEGRPPTSVPGSSPVSGATTTLEVTAESLAFTPTTLVGPAGVPFTITLRNRDDGIPHNVAIRAGLPVHDAPPDGRDLFAGETVTGQATVTYQVPALPAGTYTFYCTVHPNMIGTLTLQ